MEWLTIVATGAVTLAGVWLNGLISARADRRKLADERARERERYQREDEQKAEDADAQARADQAEVARRILDKLQEVSREVQYDPNVSFAGSVSSWLSGHFPPIRRDALELADAQVRQAIITVCDALGVVDRLIVMWTAGGVSEEVAMKSERELTMNQALSMAHLAMDCAAVVIHDQAMGPDLIFQVDALRAHMAEL